MTWGRMEQAFNSTEHRFFSHFRGHEVSTSLVKTEYGNSYDFLFFTTLLKHRETWGHSQADQPASGHGNVWLMCWKFSGRDLLSTENLHFPRSSSRAISNTGDNSAMPLITNLNVVIPNWWALVGKQTQNFGTLTRTKFELSHWYFILICWHDAGR